MLAGDGTNTDDKNGDALGLIRKIRDKQDPWSVRLEKPRRETVLSGLQNDSVSEKKGVMRKREMFGKVFDGRSPNHKNSH